MRRTLLLAVLTLVVPAGTASAETVAPVRHSVEVAPVPGARLWAVEADPALVVPLVRPGSLPAASATVRVVAEMGTVGPDFTADTVAVPFAEGQRTAEARLPLLDDDVQEFSEHFRVEVLLPGINPTPNNRADATVVDDDPVWPKPVVTVNEDKGLLAFNVERAGGGGQRFSVPLTAAGVTATAGVDFAAPGPLEFAGVPYAPFALRVIPDIVPEDDEELTITMARPARDRTTGAVRTLRVIIKDDDGEHAKPEVTAPKRRSIGAGVPVTVACPRRCAGSVELRLPTAAARAAGVSRLLATRKIAALKRSGRRALTLRVPAGVAQRLRRAAPVPATVRARTVSGTGRGRVGTAPVTLVP